MWIWKFLIPPLAVTNIEIQKYYQHESRFNGVYSRGNLSKEIKDGVHVINLDEYENVGIHWIPFYISNKDAIYFDSDGVEHVPKGFRKFIGNKNIETNIFRIQANNSLHCIK